MESVEIIQVDESNVEKLGFYCYRSKKKTIGYQSKLDWLITRFSEGLRLKLLYIENRLAGVIEYAPSESAWRVLNAPGHFVVHCLYTMGRYQGKGYRTVLLEDCIKEANEHERGVAVVVGASTFLPGRDIFDKNGFNCTDSCLESFELLHLSLNGSKSPSFPTDWNQRLSPYRSGFHVVYAPQCPYNASYLDVVTDVGKDLGIPTNIVELKSSNELQSKAPTPVGVYALIHDGEVILNHPVLEKDLRKRLMEMQN